MPIAIRQIALRRETMPFLPENPESEVRFVVVELTTAARCNKQSMKRPVAPAPAETRPKDKLMPVKVSAIDHIVINVSDVARTAKWYQTILGMEVRVFDPGHGKTPRTSLMFGNQKINVRPRDADKVEWFTADHETAGSDDLCFLTSSTPDEVAAHLKAHGVVIEEGPVARQGARGTLRSVYCRDPDGSLIEISSYEREAI
jgi:catechol 2,3-dioxygenase-like lactoylglutathione lyase family enzyme